MLIWEIFEGLNHQTSEVYHFTSAENLATILTHNSITGATTHDINGKTIHGVSTTRYAFLDLSNTYAISGRKPWRIGLDYRRLRNSFKVTPVRDEYLRKTPRGKRVTQKGSLGLFGPKTEYLVSSDEMEEFVIGDITPLSRFITSIAVEENAVDITCHPLEFDDDPDYYEEEYGYTGEDQRMFFNLVSELYPNANSLMRHRRHGTYSPRQYGLPSIPFNMFSREGHTSLPVENHLKWALGESATVDTMRLMRNANFDKRAEELAREMGWTLMQARRCLQDKEKITQRAANERSAARRGSFG